MNKMKIALVASDLLAARNYIRVHDYMVSCLKDEPEYHANIMADRVTELFRLHTHIALLYCELCQNGLAMLQLMQAAHIVCKNDKGDRTIIEPVLVLLNSIEVET